MNRTKDPYTPSEESKTSKPNNSNSGQQNADNLNQNHPRTTPNVGNGSTTDIRSSQFRRSGDPVTR